MKAIEEKLKKVLAPLKHLMPKPGYAKVTIQPAKDWQHTLLFFFAGLLCIIGIGSYVYVNVLNGSFWDSGLTQQSASVNDINQKNLDTVTTYFNQKAINFNDAQRGVTSVPDPSFQQ